ncbi:cobalamin biosynthesis protein [Natronosporangium hydrolyticum]|uniref:Cobalamin biosynthesis protein CobD n=1 Tax=Natronosporangium hydrolyticum TaxID=2811111 RepID=A0A895YGF4_9ACTN|nr:cobalamin biosynthesis protein [Natronosporangium hydrolyticum]QSB12768.1 cobalamin biosynthesis protein [Natronosporangium hydrolyticum]
MPEPQLRAWGLLAGFAADLLLGDPRRLHPVAGFGQLAAALERRIYRDQRAAGVGYVSLLTVAAAAAGYAGGALARRGGRPPALLWQAALTWTALGGRSLTREAGAVAAALDRGDLATARTRLRSLCARDPDLLDAAGVARAAVESVAENTCDAVVAPLFWGAVAGPAGTAGFRAVNTMDAMVGYHTSRYERFGWAAARLDDAANWLPARVTAGLATLLAPVVGGSPRRAWRAWRRDGPGHPSPNAGRVEAAFAGALGRRLGGSANRYGDHLDRRPSLGDGAEPTAADIRRTIRLATAVGATSALLAAAAAQAVTASARDLPVRRRR